VIHCGKNVGLPDFQTLLPADAWVEYKLLAHVWETESCHYSVGTHVVHPQKHMTVKEKMLVEKRGCETGAGMCFLLRLV